MNDTAPLIAGQPAPPLWSALQARAIELERLIARAGQGVSGIGLLLSLLVWAFVSPEIGSATLLPTLASLAWFTLLLYALAKPKPPVWALVLAPLWEISLPAVLFVVLTLAQGPDYALGSWVPSQVFSIFIAASMMRLRPWLPLAVGAYAGVLYFGCYWIFALPRLPADPPLLFAPPMQAVRTLSLVATGAFGSLALLAVRRAVSAAGADVRARDLFGKYQLLHSIATGGMGRVWEALYCPEGGFQRRVAVKLIHPHLAEDAHFIDRFRAEAEIGARLAHPNIVAALDFGRVEQTYFYAMELVDGPTLKTLRDHASLTHAPMPPALIAFIGQQLADAMHFAHEVARDAKGATLRVVHRDLSPENILLDRVGLVKVSDFGVARALRDTITQRTQQAVGKPSYMAPEVIHDHAVDPRSDLWSIGVILWELLCNERLFFRGAEAPTMLAVIDAEITPPSSIRPELDPSWDAIVLGLLTRDPEARTARAQTVAEQLATRVTADGGATSDDLAAYIASIAEERLPELALDETPPSAVG